MSSFSLQLHYLTMLHQLIAALSRSCSDLKRHCPTTASVELQVKLHPLIQTEHTQADQFIWSSGGRRSARVE